MTLARPGTPVYFATCVAKSVSSELAVTVMFTAAVDRNITKFSCDRLKHDTMHAFLLKKNTDHTINLKKNILLFLAVDAYNSSLTIIVECSVFCKCDRHHLRIHYIASWDTRYMYSNNRKPN